MEAIIERLKQEKQALTDEYKAKGKIEGQRWAKTALYRELKYAADGDVTEKWDEITGDPFADKILGDYFQEECEADPMLVLEGEPPRSPSEELAAWLDGWSDAAIEFWTEVEGQLHK